MQHAGFRNRNRGVWLGGSIAAVLAYPLSYPAVLWGCWFSEELASREMGWQPIHEKIRVFVEIFAWPLRTLLAWCPESVLEAYAQYLRWWGCHV